MTKHANDTHGYHVYIMYHDYETSGPITFQAYVQIPRSIGPEDDSLADAILQAVLLADERFRGIVEPGTHVNSSGWNRRLAKGGPIDELSSGVQAMYFSPNGQTVCLFAYIDAEWLD